MQEYTLTIGIDRSMEGDTRAVSATEDDDPTRCFMQVFDAAGAGGEVYTQEGSDNYSFTVKLAASSTYTFCFWADNSTSTQEITDLTNVPYTPGTLAFALKAEGTAAEVIADGIKLTHAVAKVTLQSSTDVTIAENKSLSVTTQCAATYNALTRTASGTQDYATPETSGSFSANADVTSFYVLPAAATQSITLNAHLLTQTIPDVPLEANTHVTLQGDLSENNENWQATPEYYYYDTFYSCFFNSGGGTKGSTFYATSATVTKLVTEIMGGQMPSVVEVIYSRTFTTRWGESITITDEYWSGFYYSIKYNNYTFYIYTSSSYHGIYPDITL